jgi:hypothetical protein
MLRQKGHRERKIRPLFGFVQSNLAGDENGFAASTTNMTSECRSVEPLLETCIGVLAPCPAMV